MVELIVLFKRLAEVYPNATITFKELNKFLSDMEVGVGFASVCVDEGAPDTPYLRNGDPGEPGWAPEFEHEFEGFVFEGENVSVAGVDYQTFVTDLDLNEEADEVAANQMEDL